MKLDLKMGVKPYDLLGDGSVILHCRPALTEIVEEAKADPALLEFSQSVMGDLSDELAGDLVAEGASPDLSPELIRSRSRMSILFTKALARLVIEGWEGIENEDGTPAPVDADHVDALLDHVVIYDAFTAIYIGRWLLVQAEKNVSAPSLTGTSGAVPTTAKAVKRPAKPARKS